MKPARQRGRHAFPVFDHGHPIKAFSPTPFAILAAALVAIALPFQGGKTHAVVIDLPILAPPNATTDPRFVWPHPPQVNRLSIDAKSVLMWNGEPIDPATLVERLEQTRTLNPQPYLLFEPAADASYDTAVRTLNIIFRSGLTDNKFCLMGMEKHRTFHKDTSGANPTMPAKPKLRLSYTLTAEDNAPIQLNKIVVDVPAFAEECAALAKLP